MSVIRIPVGGKRGQQRVDDSTDAKALVNWAQADESERGKEDVGNSSDDSVERFATPGRHEWGEKGEGLVDRRTRGRPTNREMLSRHRDSNFGSKQIFEKWRQGGSQTDKSDEGEKTKDSKRSREEEGIEGGEEKLRKKLKKKSPSERSKVKGKVDLESLENLIKGFREETNQSLKGVQRRGEEVWEEVKKVREKWEEWDQVWRKEKDKVWKKLEEIEKKQKANENERKYDSYSIIFTALDCK